MDPVAQQYRNAECGLGLIGLLVVLVMLAAMAAAVVKTLEGTAGTGAQLLATTLPPEVVGGGNGTAAESRAAGLAGAAATAGCEQSLAVVEAAMTAARTLQGRYPASLAELAAAGHISEAPTVSGYSFDLAQEGGRPTGKVLVNGLPGDEGCRAGPRQG